MQNHLLEFYKAPLIGILVCIWYLRYPYFIATHCLCTLHATYFYGCKYLEINLKYKIIQNWGSNYGLYLHLHWYIDGC